MADDTQTMQTGDDPADFTVPQVQEYLDSLDRDEAGGAEAQRVLDAERAGQERKGILEHDLGGASSDDAHTPQGERTSTKAQTFAEAAKAATPDDKGYAGISPEAERTGRRDKGLSQRNPAILSGGPVPDSRASVDDDEALAALRDDSSEG